jgi:tetratricopeptide (TPR) repeat protein
VRSQQQQLDLAQDLANDAMHMYKRLGDRVGEAHGLNGLGLAAIDAGRSDEAEELLKTTVAICEETRDAQAREVFLLNMGVVCLDRGDWARARDIFTENLSFARANHDDLDVAMSSENLREAHLIGGEPDKAAAGQRGPPGRRPGRVPSARSAGRRARPGLAGQEASLWPSQLRRLPPSPEPASHPPPKPCWTRPQQS